MIERREFIQTAIGTVSAMAIPALHRASANAIADPRPEWTTTIEQTLVASDDRELLGIPKSLQCVREGLHPFSPERVLILPRQARDARQAGHAEEIAQAWGDVGVPINVEAIRLIFQAASVLTQVYRVQERTEDWASRMLVWLLQFYSSVVQDHQWIVPGGWQGFHEPVETTNGIVDWWLILIPQGVEVRSTDGTRLHTLITPVYSKVGKPRLPAFFWNFMARAIEIQPYDPGATRPADGSMRERSRLDAKSACLDLNRRIAANLTQMA